MKATTMWDGMLSKNAQRLPAEADPVEADTASRELIQKIVTEQDLKLGLTRVSHQKGALTLSVKFVAPCPWLDPGVPSFLVASVQKHVVAAQTTTADEQ